MRIQTLFASMLLVPAALAAQSKTSSSVDMSLAVRFGTPGIGVEVNKLLTSHLGARVGLNFFNYNTTRDEDDITFDAKVKFKAFTGLIDLYPGARKSFHFSAGIMTNPVEFSGVGQPKGSNFEIDNVNYTAAQVGTLNTAAKFESVLPYVGIGFGTPANNHKKVKFLFDIGAAIGQPTLTLTASNASSNATLAQSVKNQETKTNSDLQKYVKVFPSISFGLAFAF